MDTAFKIAIEFSKQYSRKYGKRLYQIRTVRDSKWWTHFERASTIISYDEVKYFMEYFFNQENFDERILPHTLYSKRGKIIYKDFSMLKGTGVMVDAKNKVNNTLREITNWCVEKGVKDNKIKNFIKDRTNVMKIERGVLFEPMFLFSKEYTENNPVEDCELKRMLFRKNHEKVYEVIKKISGDDFIE